MNIEICRHNEIRLAMPGATIKPERTRKVDGIGIGSGIEVIPPRHLLHDIQSQRIHSTRNKADPLIYEDILPSFELLQSLPARDIGSS